MKKIFSTLFFILICQTHFSQIRNLDRGLGGFESGGVQRLDSLNNDEITVKLNGKTKYTDYKIISHSYDTTIVDTTLTIKKERLFNFRRKDNFELLQFHNQGQTFNNLAYDFNNISLFPDIGFRAKQFNYIPIEGVRYYQVPTPTSEILYRTGQEQGQVLDALFALNFSKRLNASIAYKGLRSLGQYRRALASSRVFRATLSYRTSKDQYAVRFHVTKQNFMNQESGGLTPESLTYFIDNDPNFRERGRLDVSLIDTENTLKTSRFYLNHNLNLVSVKDSTNTKKFSNLKVGHIFTYSNKKYNFIQKKGIPDFFGNTSAIKAINDSVKSRLINNQAYLEFNSKYVLGRFKAKVNHTFVSYGYDSVLNPLIIVEKMKLKGSAVSLGADWRGVLGALKVNASANVTPGSGHLAGSNFKGELHYEKDSVFTVKGKLSLVSKAPNFNFKLFNSSYDTYNWLTSFDNINTRNLGFSFLSKWGNASLDFTNISDYVYFDEESKPQQFNDMITYLKVKVNKEFKLGKFSLDNTVMYQQASGSEVFRVPEFVTRNTLYYTDEWFKGKPLKVQIGATFKYFTKYKANAYNPLLAEFTLQNSTEIGYPTFDVFFNTRVRRTRIYFKLDNVTSSISKKNYFSAPNYPYRDMSIRFGLVWNWFI